MRAGRCHKPGKTHRSPSDGGAQRKQARQQGQDGSLHEQLDECAPVRLIRRRGLWEANFLAALPLPIGPLQLRAAEPKMLPAFPKAVSFGEIDSAQYARTVLLWVGFKPQKSPPVEWGKSIKMNVSNKYRYFNDYCANV